MSEFDPKPTHQLSEFEEAAKFNALMAYGLMVAGLFTGILWFIGAFWAMVKRSDAKGSIFEDHYSNIISIFWWSMLFSVIGFILLFIFIGYFILFATWIWAVFKIVKGLAKISSNRAYNP